MAVGVEIQNDMVDIIIIGMLADGVCGLGDLVRRGRFVLRRFRRSFRRAFRGDELVAGFRGLGLIRQGGVRQLLQSCS